jgi:hypothetical protein
MCSVFKQELKVENLYWPPEPLNKKSKRLRKIKEDGIYIFGGKRANG